MTENTAPTAQSAWRALGEWITRNWATTPEQVQRGRLEAAVLIALWVVILLVLPFNVLGIMSQEAGPLASLLAWGLVAFWAGLFVLNRRGFTDLSGVGMALTMLVANLLIILQFGTLAPGAAALVLLVIVAGLFGPPFSALVIALLAALGYLGLNLRADPAYFQAIAGGDPAAQTLIVYLNLLVVGLVSWLFARLTRRALRESRVMSLALVEQRQFLASRLDEQTRQLQAVITVSRAIVGSREVNQLLDDMVRLVRETFGYYHVQIFLIDEDRGYATLRQSTGDVGQKLLERGHRLPVGSMSVIGQVTATGQPVVARDTDHTAVHRRNELLPDTRSEMALPLTVGDTVIGALDLQSVEADAFDEEAIPTLQALADQFALAIQNARLFQQAEENLRELRDLSIESTRRSWSEFLAEASEEEIQQSYGSETKALATRRSQIVDRVLNAGSVIISTGSDGSATFLAVPVVVRNEVVGVLGVEPNGPREWTQADLSIMEGIAQRTALAVENARLYIEAQRAAHRERMVSSIAERLQRAPSLSLLLESAAKELASALGTDRVYAELSVDQPMAQRRKQVSQQGGDGDDQPENPPGEAAEARMEK
jgi:GAF domain-containing protein